MYSYIYTWWPTVSLAEECYNNNITHSAPSTHSYESANMSGTPHFFNRSFWILNTKQSRYNSLEQVIISSQNLGETPLTARTAYYYPPPSPRIWDKYNTYYHTVPFQ